MRVLFPRVLSCTSFLWIEIASQTLLRLMDKILQRTLNYGNYGIFLIMGHAGFCPSTVAIKGSNLRSHNKETILFTVDPYGFPYGIKPCYCVGFGGYGYKS